MPDPLLPPIPDTQSVAHERVCRALWDQLRRLDISHSNAFLTTLRLSYSEVTTLLKRPKPRVRPTKLKAVKW